MKRLLKVGKRATEFVVGRVATDPGDWPIEFRLKLMGAYRWIAFAHAFTRMLPSAQYEL